MSDEAASTRAGLDAWMRGEIAAATGVLAEEVDLGRSFGALGLDSLAAVAMLGELSRLVGREVAVSELFEHGAPDRLLDALMSGSVATTVDVDWAARPDGRRIPVAITGMACRFPGAPDPHAFWRMLREATGAVGPPPPERRIEGWSDPDEGVPDHGGYLAAIDQFDAGAFDISEAEADRMDPQQRLLLEVTWEAIEDAGIRPATLRGSRTGVFVGISSSDYAQRYLHTPEQLDGMVATGNALSIAANRLSFTFDLRGPSMAIDTACSSSLVAVHQACRAIADGECEIAIVAAANLVLEPGVSLALHRAGMLAPDGRCKTFDDRADGYVRGEGVGAIVLEAQPAEWSRSYASVLGSAVTQDGATAGLTAPNPAAQRAVVAAAWRAADVDVADVDYVECHGTGTALGDPIEVEALGAVLGRARKRPCLIGSVKSNIGHLEAAAGIAGLIKAALAVHHAEIPPTLNFEEPNHRIDFSGLGIEVAAGATQGWPVDSTRRLCGVSSFGFGGTNAHVALGASGRSETARPIDDGPALPVPLSSPTPTGLDQLVGRWTSALRRGALGDLPAASRTAALHRSEHRYRRVAVGSDGEEIARDLAGDAPVHLATDRAPELVMVFAGQGSSWTGDATTLLSTCSSFRSVLTYCDAVLGDLAGWSLLEGVVETPAVFDHVQPARVAFQLALAAAWRSFGVHPAAVIGHSLGEIAAAQVAGVLTVDEALTLALRRGEAMADIRPGGMLATDLREPDAEVLASDTGLDIAAVNADDIVILSGLGDAIERAASELLSRGRMARRLDLPAFHSGLTTDAANRLLDDPPGLRRPAELLWCSTVTGSPVVEIEEDHWARNVRQTVRFRDALLATSAELGSRVTTLGIGPPRMLGGAIGRVVGTESEHLESMHADHDAWRGLLRTAGRLWQLGTPIDWSAATPRTAVCSLPNRPWSRSRHWVDRSNPRRRPMGHPLLGARRELAGLEAEVFESVVSTRALPFLADHRVDGIPVMPAAGFVQILAEAGGISDHAVRLTDVEFQSPLFLDDEDCVVQTTLHPPMGGTRRATIHSRRDGDEDWIAHVSALVGVDPGAADAASIPYLSDDADDVTVIDRTELYRRLGTVGLDYGPAFRVVETVAADSVGAAGHIHASGDLVAASCGSDPRVIDGALHLVAALLPPEVEGRVIVMPVAVREIVVYESILDEVDAAIRLEEEADGVAQPGSVLFGLQLNRDGRVAVRASGVRLRMITRDEPEPDESPVRVYERVWTPASSAATETFDSLDGRRVGLVMSDGPLRDALVSELSNSGAEILALPPIDAGVDADANVWLDPDSVDELLGPLAGGADRAHVVVVLSPSVDGSDPDLDHATRFLHLLQTLSFLEGSTTPRLWVVSHGAHDIVEGERVEASHAALCFGLARVLPFENPLLQCRFVDVDTSPAVAARQLVGELRRAPDEAEIACRGDDRFVRRLRPSPIRSRPPASRAGGSYLVTGGAGALGMLTASRLLERGAAVVGLVARRAPDGDVASMLDRWRDEGLPVRSYQIDVSQSDQLGRVLEELRSIAPMRGVVHAAGTLQDGALLEMTRDSLQKVLVPKVLGAWNLHRATLEDDLEMFALFSSAASVVGSPGQANYCAANAYLDALAAQRRSMGLPGVSINWGPWSEVGMAAALGATDSSAAIPLPIAESSIAPGDGINAFDMLADGSRSVLAVGVDLVDLVRFYPAELGYSLFEEVNAGQQHDLRGHGRREGPMARPHLDREYVAPQSPLEARIVAIWESSLGIEPIGVHDGFFELGGDSVFANQILVQIRRVLGVELDSEEAFAEFTVANLAAMADSAIVARIDAMSDEEVARVLEG